MFNTEKTFRTTRALCREELPVEVCLDTTEAEGGTDPRSLELESDEKDQRRYYAEFCDRNGNKYLVIVRARDRDEARRWEYWTEGYDELAESAAEEAAAAWA